MSWCPFCGRSTSFESHGPFRDELSFREFRLSGLCQACQDEFFCSGTPKDEEDYDAPNHR